MRTPPILLSTLAILFASCASQDAVVPVDPTPVNGQTAKPSKITGDRIRAEWRNLNPKHGERQFGLVNRSSPEVPRLAQAGRLDLKPIADQDMEDLLATFAESGFYEHAQRGRTAGTCKMGEGHGVVSLIRGDEKWALVFRPTGGVKSDVPEIYLGLKELIIAVYNRTLSLQVTTPQDPNKVFRQPKHKYRRSR
ncbi:MAG: hypothetical protein ACYTDY_00345 [Planctomycetota bacterium]|jgi:hypothetical protein